MMHTYVNYKVSRLMKIVDYSKKEMSERVIELFSTIYPNWTMEELNRITYDEDHQLHVTTKIAIINDQIVGQANIFRLLNNPTVANLGYHVHPDYRRRGIGIKLSTKAMKIAKKSGIKTIIVQTEADNLGAIILARKLGFEIPPKSFLEENKSGLKIHRLRNGICLYKRI
jgi:RimJ/RimL family protein N-acetyltransferase